MFDRLRDALGAKKQPPAPTPVRLTEKPADLQRGDVIVLWEGGDAVVTATLDCWENLNGRQTTWRWLMLSSGSVVEAAGAGDFIYGAMVVLRQGSGAFGQLIGSQREAGALQRFEARVREGTVDSDPVTISIDGVLYRVLGTGAFLCDQNGPLTAEVWRDLSAEEGQNVYVRLQGSDGSTALAIWTTHIALLKGKPLPSSAIKGLYGA